MIRSVVFAAALAALFVLPAAGQEGLPPPVVPRGWGVNIHSTDPAPGEMARFGEVGYRLARTDLFWDRVEKVRGVYDFSACDRLVAELARAGARPVFVLGYVNPLYDDGLAPHTDAGRAAFARFAGAAAARYKGRGVLWEIGNKPNLAQSWKPQPDAAGYAALAVAAARALRAADSRAVVLGPASSGFPWDFLEAVFRSGLLAHLDAVSVHPYRDENPETAGTDYARLRALIARHAPPGKRDLPIVSGEWGYSTAEKTGVAEDQQARYLARQWLANLAFGVNLSIADDAPGPAFPAAKRLIADLDGYAFRHRLQTLREQDWRLLFERGEDLAVVVWTTDEKAPPQDRMPEVLKIARETKGHETLRRAAAFRYAAGARAAGASLDVVVVNGEKRAASVRVTVGGTVRVVHVPPGGQARLSFPLHADFPGEADLALLPVEAFWNDERVTDLPAVPLVRYESSPLRR